MTYGPADPRKLFVRPREGYVVRHPVVPFRELAQEGEAIPPEHRSYFLRRLAEGSVEECAPPIPPSKEA